MLQIHYNKNTNCAYVLLPFQRNQDVIQVRTDVGDARYVVSVVDGFNFRDKIHGNAAGRQAATFVANNFGVQFMHAKGKSYFEKAKRASIMLDTLFIEKFPKYVSAVGSFLFHFQKEDVIVALGTINTFIWREGRWVKPKEIGNYFLDYPKYYSGSRTFFGLGEVKNNPLYSNKPDVVVISALTPVLIATDGIDDVLNLEDINRITEIAHKGKLLETILHEIQKRGTQKDDISILLRWPHLAINDNIAECYNTATYG
jgi:hypothetical protein